MKDDGGPAFPVNLEGTTGRYKYMPQDGMTLRDYFAGQAMIAMIQQEVESDITIDQYAETAYDWADAMIAERSKD